MNLLRITYLILLCCGVIANSCFGQESNFKSRTLVSSSDTIKLDSLSIYPLTFKIKCGEEELGSDAYYLDGINARFLLYNKCEDSISVEYRTFNMALESSYANKDTTLIYTGRVGEEQDYFYSTQETETNFFGSSINKSGSISRGISFGNNQDLSVNSSLNLQLSGDIAPNVKLLASVSDDNIPIQPDGNTNKLQEFDQIFIQIFNDKFKIIAGDFWLKKPKGYFMNYNKRAQGLYGQYTWSNKKDTRWSVQGAGALSKGKFSRNIIQGTEGNQGPYRLKGNENEAFIIVLSGTEVVYLDGRVLERGQEFDYTINYNTAEVVFTTRNLITKDSRIVVEFQYSDQNYARSLFQGSAMYESKKLNYWLNMYTEQDAKNQSLQQDLSFADKQLLSDVGDSVFLAQANSIDSVGYNEQQILYALIDSLGYDSVLLYTVAPDSAFYRASFTEVGNKQGDYVFDRYTALGKVFKWVAPVGGVPQGNYIPAKLLLAPKRKQLVTMGASYKINNNFSIETELATSKNDQNTFSRIDKGNDNAFSNRTKLIGDFNLGKDSIKLWKFVTISEVEIVGKYFSPIERFRSVEFDRNWNVRGKNYTGNQVLANLNGTFKHKKKGSFGFNFENYTVGKDYQGNRAGVEGSWKSDKGFNANYKGSYLNANTEINNTYIRHKVDVSQNLKIAKIGYTDDHEFNSFYKTRDSISTTSYQWYDWKVYLMQPDSAINGFSVFYRERYDRKSDSVILKQAAVAKHYGASYDWVSRPNSRLNLLASYRQLQIKDSALINQKPENSVVGRANYNLKLWKGALTNTTFYEVASGLELKKEFLYFEVNSGQGVYTWIDYNGDGVKDLNEFEVAQFIDEADYIRVFTPSNEYVKTFSNEFNQSIFWRPERIWARKKGALNVLSRFSNQTRFQIRRKTSDAASRSYNPFTGNINDTALISSSSSIRNTTFFNRTNSIFGMDYTYSNVTSKTLLANGFDARTVKFNELSFRFNFAKKFTLKSSGKIGEKVALADYTSGRNYKISYFEVEPNFIYQPNTKFRLSIESRYAEKKNDILLGGEKSVIRDIGLQLKYNQTLKGSLQCGFNAINISYTGTNNNAVGFEMLESLKPGQNFTWNIGYQRNVSKNLQISVQYNGRKSESNRAIHAGGLEVRAFF